MDISRFLIVLLLFGWSVSGTALTLLNIDFGQYGIPSSSYGAASGQAGPWNAVAESGSTSGLIDITGAITTAAVEAYGKFNGYQALPPGNEQRLLGDMYHRPYLDPTAWRVALTGLQKGRYDVYYYAPAHPMTTGEVAVNTIRAPSLPGAPTGDLIAGVSWGVVTGVPVRDGRMLIRGTAPNAGGECCYTGIAGVQLAPSAVPLPGPLGVFFVAVAVLLGRNRLRHGPGSVPDHARLW